MRLRIDYPGLSLDLGKIHETRIDDMGVSCQFPINEHNLKLLEVLLGMGLFTCLSDRWPMVTGGVCKPRLFKIVLEQESGLKAQFDVEHTPTFDWDKIKDGQVDSVTLKIDFCHQSATI